MTAAEIEAACIIADLSEERRAIARAYLLEGRAAIMLARELGITRQAVYGTAKVVHEAFDRFRQAEKALRGNRE